MKKLLYTVMCCCALASCTNLDSERYDAINPDFFPTNEKDAEALVVGGVYAPCLVLTDEGGRDIVLF